MDEDDDLRVNLEEIEALENATDEEIDVAIYKSLRNNG